VRICDGRMSGTAYGTIVLHVAPEAAAGGPLAPCEPASPAFPVFANPPQAQNWHKSELGPGWSPPGCVSWAAEPFTVLTALAGRFDFAGSADDLLLRFGAISAWRGMLYWSVTDKRYQTLVTNAAALSGPDSSLHRPDFTLGELRSGADLYFMQQDNRSSDAVVYRLRVLAINSDRLVVNVENVTSVSIFIFTAFDPGDLKSTYIFTRLSPTSWGYYSLSGAREGAALGPLFDRPDLAGQIIDGLALTSVAEAIAGRSDPRRWSPATMAIARLAAAGGIPNGSCSPWITRTGTSTSSSSSRRLGGSVLPVRGGGRSGNARQSTPAALVAAAVRQATRAPEDRPPTTRGSRPSTWASRCSTTAVHAVSSDGARGGARRPATR